MRRVLQVLAWLSLWLAFPGVALACRYSVRDTGFVDLGNSPLRLELSADSSFPADARTALAQAASAVLLDSNVSFSALPEARQGEPALLRLVDSEGRGLILASGPAVPRTRTDAVHLMEGVAFSAMRDSLLKEALRAYAVILLVEGSDDQANARAREAAQAAINTVARLIPGMPKPVDVPPQILSLPRAAQAAESVLLWGLGLDPAPSKDPRLTIVYGRGRRLGTPLEGPLITQTVLRERLVLVGQDCECDLDRAWLRGPLVPGRWDHAMQEAAAKSLGFDPENPVVRAEVSRIVDRNPLPGQRRKTGGTSHPLGYSEDSVDSMPAPADLVDSAPESDPAKPAPQAAPTRSETPVVGMVTPSTNPLWYLLGLVVASASLAGFWLVKRAPQR